MQAPRLVAAAPRTPDNPDGIPQWALDWVAAHPFGTACIWLGICAVALVLLWMGLPPKDDGAGGAKAAPLKEKLGRYTRQQVSAHAAADDCWVIIKGRVYDVTPYVQVCVCVCDV